MQSALDTSNFQPEEGYLELLEDQIRNLPVMIQYVVPAASVTTAADESANTTIGDSSTSTAIGKKRSNSTTSAPLSPESNHKRKKQALSTPSLSSSSAGNVKSFTFNMYPSEEEELSYPGNKRLFAVRKTKDLCLYAQAMNRLVIPTGRGRGSFSAKKDKDKDKTKDGNDENGAFATPGKVDDANTAVGMCFAGISTSNKTNGQGNPGKVTTTAAATTTTGPKTAENGTEVEKKEPPKYTPKVLTFAGQTFAASIGCTQVGVMFSDMICTVKLCV